MSFLNTRLLSIGHVESEIKSISIPLQDNNLQLNSHLLAEQMSHSATAKIVIEKELEDCLDGIEQFSHIVVTFLTDTPEETRINVKKVHPGGCVEVPLKGIFSCRSPVRPNPLGISTVKLRKVEGNILTVEDLDAIDKTVILDIKPYVGELSDIAASATIAPWVFELSNIIKMERVKYES